MLAFKLALRNLLGAGLRTWLNVIVLSFALLMIVWLKGLLEGWDKQARKDMISWEIGGGQYWHENYDPYDPFTLTESHGVIPDKLAQLIDEDFITPILISQGTIYPSGRLIPVVIKGIQPDQKILALPTNKLISDGGEIPAIIGKSMAKSTRLNEGDYVTIRWRDKNGTFDATEIRIAGIFETTVPTVDVNQLWIPINRLQEMMLMPGEATILVTSDTEKTYPSAGQWIFRDHDYLLMDMEKIIQAKSLAGIILWIIMLALAMLAIFDTQILSIFRRQKEIGMYVALGMTRRQVVALFTIEGAMHSILATLLGAAYGFPLLASQSVRGIAIPVSSEDFGISMAEKLYPVYSLGLILGTVIIVLSITTVVSYLPSRKIAKLSPTDALRGKIQ
jgi:ABC-type lipoprotein release transport system permease subunit